MAIWWLSVRFYSIDLLNRRQMHLTFYRQMRNLTPKRYGPLAWFTCSTLHAAVHALACMGACMDDACTAHGRRVDGCVDGAWTARVWLRVWPHVCTVAGAIQIHSNTVTQSCIWKVLATVHTCSRIRAIHAPSTRRTRIIHTCAHTRKRMNGCM